MKQDIIDITQLVTFVKQLMKNSYAI
jgi:hypothetical protein